jgi:hypothetical protein
MGQANTVEVGDIFRQYGAIYRKSHEMPFNQLRAMRAIELCRTAELGGHVEECDTCGSIRISYNSCRNRHCPKCQFLNKERWIEARAEDLLPIEYFHVVFTITDELNPLALRNQRVLYNILFRSVSETLTELSRDPEHLGAELGFISILHTWGQNLMDHPHIHCIVTGGGLSEDGKRWVSCRDGFFLPVKVLSRLFRGKFLDYLKKSYESGKLEFHGEISELEDPEQFAIFLRGLYEKEWVVYCKRPFKGIEMVLEYLGRYTHKVAISNHRIIGIEDKKVLFSWRDYADGNRDKIMRVDVFEFIRRYLLHILPERFVKIRYYGLLGNRNRRQKIGQCRSLLGVSNEIKKENGNERWEEFLMRVCGIDIMRCPFCKKGRMVIKEIIFPKRFYRPP